MSNAECQCMYIIKLYHIAPWKFQGNHITVRLKAFIPSCHKQCLAMSLFHSYTCKIRTQSNAKDILQNKHSHNFLLIKKKHNDELKEKPFSEKQFTAPKESKNQREKAWKKVGRAFDRTQKSLKMVGICGSPHLEKALYRLCRDVRLRVTYFPQTLHSMVTQGGLNPENMVQFSRLTINTGCLNTVTFVMLISRVLLKEKTYSFGTTAWGDFKVTSSQSLGYYYYLCVCV